MRSAPPLHRVTIGRTRETRGPDALERGMAGAIIVAATCIGLVFGARLIQMTETVDAVSLAAGPETNAVIYRAERGHWPRAQDPAILPAGGKGRFAKHLTLSNHGVLTAHLALSSLATLSGGSAAGSRHGDLSFRPELLGSRAAPSVSFLCGAAPPTAGAVEISPAGPTTLPKKFLPPFCR